ncbi:hypothetical protein [Chryseobacterium sp. RRHN12]|uniref:hypothetical protein n=1 Tax=Chryseobacterium sp. RRHN12 TaxID=3437884 RepID=UPI003D9B4800
MEETQKTFLSRLGGKHRLTYLKLAGSIIVILSGFVPFTDNIWSWIDPGFNTMLDGRGVKLRSDIWIESLYVAILMCCIGRYMRAYSHCYILPIYASLYSLTMYELMRFGYEIDPDWWHRLGFLIMLIPFIYVIYRLNEHIKDLKLKDEIQFKTIESIVNKNDAK